MSNESASTQKIPVSCNKDCGGGCPLTAHVVDGRVKKITNSTSGSSYTTGCANGLMAHKVLYHPDRLTTPLMRTGPKGSGQFESVSWDVALDHIADKLSGLKAKYGSESILHLGASGSCHSALNHTGKTALRFLRLFGRTSERVGSYSIGAANFAVPYILGSGATGLDAGTLKHSKLIILWGANITDTRLGNEKERWILERKKQGVPVIVIDPRRSRSVERLATQWIPVRPGTDTALMSAVLYVLINEGLVDEQFINTYSVGFDEMKGYITGAQDGVPKTPQWAEEICGTKADVIIAFARHYAQTKPAALIPGLSIQRTVGGEEAARMAVVLQTVTANTGLKGGSSGANVWAGLKKPWCGSLPIPDRTDRLEVNAYMWPDAILEGKAGGYPGDIKAVYNVGGNFLSQGSDIKKNIRAFEKLEFAVCHEIFMTPTARYCDVVLPVSVGLEREDIIFPDNNYILYTHQAVNPLHDVKSDYDIFCELADRLGFLSEYTENRTKDEWLAHFIDTSEIDDVDEFKKTGIYKGEEHSRTALSDFIADPVANPLSTPSGLIEISSTKYTETGFPAYPHCRYLPEDDKFPLRLVTPHARYRINSSNSNVDSFRSLEQQALWMHPQDAETRGLSDGETVAVFNDRGKMHIPVRVTEDIMPGVACLLQGVWPEFNDDNIEIAGSVNILTSTEPTLPSKESRTHSVLVEVSAIVNT